MKPRRTAIGLILFVAALAAFFVVRSHVAPPAERAPEQVPAGRSSPTPSYGVASAPSVATDAAASTGLPPPNPATSNKTTPASVVPPVAQNSSTPTVDDPAVARADAAAVNAVKVRRMITDYHTVNGENPVGTNAEIMAAIMGKNPRQAVLGPPEGVNLNSRGELVDDWGTPYFFHQLSRDVMEIHSAGPDRTMGTADDIVVR